MSLSIYPGFGQTKVRHALLFAVLLFPFFWLGIKLIDDLSLQGARHSSTSLELNSTLFSLSEKVSNYYHQLTHTTTNTSLEANKSTPSWVTADITTSKKVAAIVETRRSGNIVPLILHFATVLGPDWPVVIYTDAENFGSFSSSSALSRFQKAGRIVLRPLANGVYFPNWDSVTKFLTDKWLWNDLAPAEHVLLFQSDSILCSNSVRSVEEFLQWDLIGAPIVPQRGVGYNGGLSLRKRETVLRVLDEWKGEHPEDQWYYKKMKILMEREQAEGTEDGIKLPSMEIARSFAVETIDYPNPLGLHQPTRYLKEHMLSLDDWCPEYKLATTDRISPDS